MKIGLLEDNPSVLEYMTTALALAGHTVFPFSYGSTLIEALLTQLEAEKAFPYELLIVDLILSGAESGAEVVAYVRDTFTFAKLPVIIVSAATIDELENVRTRFPEVPVLRKPFQLHTLLHAVEQSSVLRSSQYTG